MADTSKHGQINPQEITGWISHCRNPEYIRSVRDHCNERLGQLGEPEIRPPHRNLEKGTRSIPKPVAKAQPIREVLIPDQNSMGMEAPGDVVETSHQEATEQDMGLEQEFDTGDVEGDETP